MKQTPPSNYGFLEKASPLNAALVKMSSLAATTKKNNNIFEIGKIEKAEKSIELAKFGRGRAVTTTVNTTQKRNKVKMSVPGRT